MPKDKTAPPPPPSDVVTTPRPTRVAVAPKVEAVAPEPAPQPTAQKASEGPVAPEVTHVAYGDSDPVPVAEAAKVEAQAAKVRSTQQQFSPFRSSPNHASGFIDILGTRFYYKEIPDPVSEWVTKQFTWIANEKLGITLENFLLDDFAGARVEGLKELPQLLEDTWTVVAERVLVGWSDESVPFSPEWVRDLSREAKTLIAHQARRGSDWGRSFSQFR